MLSRRLSGVGFASKPITSRKRSHHRLAGDIFVLSTLLFTGLLCHHRRRSVRRPRLAIPSAEEQEVDSPFKDYACHESHWLVGGRIDLMALASTAVVFSLEQQGKNTSTFSLASLSSQIETLSHVDIVLTKRGSLAIFPRNDYASAKELSRRMGDKPPTQTQKYK